MTAADYKRAHELPLSLGLRSTAMREAMSEAGRERIAERPDIAANLAAGRRPDVVTRRQELARIAQQESRAYAGVRAARVRGGQGHAAAALARIDAAAAAAGHADIRAYLAHAERAGLSVSQMARELRVGRTRVGRWKHALSPRAD